MPRSAEADPHPGRSGRTAGRRLIDIGAAFLGLCLLCPILVLIACVILVESGRPVLFSQPRLGAGGRPFRMYKFRKFGESCPVAGLALTLEDDPRLTRVGRFLQASKLDELPQLWNILRGDMTIVGPRPESPVYGDCYRGKFSRLLDHKPGIFGPNQIIFRNEGRIFSDAVDLDAFYRNIMFPLKACIDIDYFDNRSAASDLRCFGACLLVISGRSPARYLEKLHAGCDHPHR